MKLLITLAFVLASIGNNSFASPGQPVAAIFSKTFLASLKDYEQSLTKSGSSAKICSCQILRVKSNNEPEKLIAVFAQVTNKGDFSAAYASASAVLQKEKKHLQGFFYSKVKTEENVNAASPCSLLYKNIKVKYDDVKLYGVLDADALSKIISLNGR
ncbi:MAG: hypothetical protein JST58_14810 [Bacteroidetes bacterium]|nr:hypothetical protein [Bacteroidota bacterium]